MFAALAHPAPPFLVMPPLTAALPIYLSALLPQNANRRPNTYKVLTLPCVRDKATELGIPMPDQLITALKAEKAAAPKVCFWRRRGGG